MLQCGNHQMKILMLSLHHYSPPPSQENHKGQNASLSKSYMHLNTPSPHSFSNSTVRGRKLNCAGRKEAEEAHTHFWESNLLASKADSQLSHKPWKYQIFNTVCFLEVMPPSPMGTTSKAPHPLTSLPNTMYNFLQPAH
jgi:hypothetical protein